MAKKKKWTKFRHRVVRNIACFLLKPYAKIKYGIKVQKHKQRGQYLILMNHQTAFDQFFCGMAFKGPIYYVASEDLFSNGWLSRIIKFLVAPIPIKKQTTDVRAVINCMKVAKEGGTIAMAPEGNRTYSGKTEYMNKAVASLAKKLGLPIAFLRIEGGYGVHPRWSDVVRKGKMKAYVSRVIQPDEYKQMSDAELFEQITKELYVNEACQSGEFKHKKLAEYLERAIYVCPHCGLASFESHDKVIECKSCGRQVEYTNTKLLKGVGFDFEFSYVNDWYEYQCAFVNNLDTRDYYDKPMFVDKALLQEVIVYKNKEVIKEETTVTLYGNKIVVDDIEGQPFVLPFDEVTAVTVLGRNKLNVYHRGRVYQFKGDKRFNAIKYVNVYYRNKNINSGDNNAKFLGL